MPGPPPRRRVITPDRPIGPPSNRRSDRLELRRSDDMFQGARLARIQEDRRGAPEAHRERPQPTPTTPQPARFGEVDP